MSFFVRIFPVLILAIIFSPQISFSHENLEHIGLIGQSKADSMEKCVEPTNIMRKKHYMFLYHQRDKTVINGIRTKQHSLANCINCHVSYDNQGKAIPINSDGEFCSKCHLKTATNIDCFSCHASVPRFKKNKKISFKDNDVIFVRENIEIILENNN